MRVSKPLVASLCTLVLALVAVVFIVPAGQAKSVKGLSPGVVVVKQNKVLNFSVFNPTTKTVDVQIELKGPQGTFFVTTQSQSVNAGQWVTDLFFACTSPFCAAVPVVTPSTVVVSGSYTGYSHDYEVDLPAGAFRTV